MSWNHYNFIYSRNVVHFCFIWIFLLAFSSFSDSSLSHSTPPFHLSSCPSASVVHLFTFFPPSPTGLLFSFPLCHMSPAVTDDVMATHVCYGWSLHLTDPGSVQGPDGAFTEHAGSWGPHAEVKGDHRAWDPSGQCECVMCMHAVCVCVHVKWPLLSFQITVSEYDDQRKDISTMYNRITLRQLQRMAPSVSLEPSLKNSFEFEQSKGLKEG